MVATNVSCRRLSSKFQRRCAPYLQFIIIFFICGFLFDQLIRHNNTNNIRRKKVNVQKDLLDYNEDDLRPEWPFQIDKHYDVAEVYTYTQKQKVIAKVDLPGERGKKRSVLF